MIILVSCIGITTNTMLIVSFRNNSPKFVVPQRYELGAYNYISGLVHCVKCIKTPMGEYNYIHGLIIAITTL